MKIFLTVLLILLTIFLLCTVFCLFVKIRIRLKLSKKNNEKLKSAVIFETLGGKFKKDLSALVGKEKQKKETPKPKKETPNRSFSQKVKKYYELFLKIKYTYSLSKLKIRKNIFAEKIMLDLKLGLDDAASTGIATGAVWAGIYNVIAFLANIITVSEPQIKLTPDYENNMLSLDSECIITLRLANIISIITSIGINYLIVTHKIKKLKKQKNKKGGD